MLRSRGATSLTRLPSIAIVPPEMSSRPAIMRSAVDLPDPDGPTSTMNSRSFTSRLNLSMTGTSPYRFSTSVNVTLAMRGLFLARLGRRRCANRRSGHENAGQDEDSTGQHAGRERLVEHEAAEHDRDDRVDDGNRPDHGHGHASDEPEEADERQRCADHGE